MPIYLAKNKGEPAVFGSLVLVAIVTFTTLLFRDLVVSFSVLVLGILMLAFYAIPDAVCGALSSWANHRQAASESTGARL